MDGQVPDPNKRLSCDDDYQDHHASTDQADFKPPSIPDPEPPLRLTHDDYEEEDFVGEIVDESSLAEDESLIDDAEDMGTDGLGDDAIDVAVEDEAWENDVEDDTPAVAESSQPHESEDQEAITSEPAEAQHKPSGPVMDDTADVIDLCDGEADADEPLQLSFDSMFGEMPVKPRPIEHTPVDEDESLDDAAVADPVIDADEEPMVDAEPQLVVAEVPSTREPNQAEDDSEEIVIEGDDAVASCEIEFEPTHETALGPQPKAGFDPTAYLIEEDEEIELNEEIELQALDVAQDDAVEDDTQRDPEPVQVPKDADTLSWAKSQHVTAGQTVLNPTPLGLAMAAETRREEKQAPSSATRGTVMHSAGSSDEQAGETPVSSFEPDWQWRLRGRRQLVPLALGCRVVSALSFGAGATVAAGFAMSGVWGAAAIYGLAGLGLAIVSWTVATMADLIREMCQ